MFCYLGMFLHQFRDDFILALELVAQGRDGAEVLALGSAFLRSKAVVPFSKNCFCQA